MNVNLINVLKQRHFKSGLFLQNPLFLQGKSTYSTTDNLKHYSANSKTDNSNNTNLKVDKNKVNKKSEVNLLEFRNKLLNGPHLRDFFNNDLFNDISSNSPPLENESPQVDPDSKPRKVYFDVYGCQMNVNDTEIVYGILKANNQYERTLNHLEADVILIMTCAIRDSAEERIWGRLSYFKGLRRGRPHLKVGVLGCMAERLKERVLERERTVDVVAGPDAYRDLPRLLATTRPDQKSVNVQLSFDETYADVAPVRLNTDAVSAYVSIMRGCDNMCTYCIVPFTRGRERSRPPDSILKEVELLWEDGVREVTLLGQNVNSYNYLNQNNSSGTTSTTQSTNSTTSNSISTAPGFKTVYKPKKSGVRFAELLRLVAGVNPEMRVRFTSPHPKDFPDDVLETIANHSNICKSLHMPAQSGSSTVLERMRRGYSREAYLSLVDRIRYLLPDVALTSDFICGFCGETEAEFEETITLMEAVRFNFAYLFAYSMRERTTAHRRFKDDVPPQVKQQRLERMINLFRAHALQRNSAQVGRTHLVLVEGVSKKNSRFLQGRNDHNTRVILPAGDLHLQTHGGVSNAEMGGARPIQKGDYVAVYINDANSQTLKGIPLYRTTLQDFYKQQDQQQISSYRNVSLDDKFKLKHYI